MSQYSKVAWKDGMFLLPQHFQQAERSLEAVLRQQLLGPQPLAWGIIELAVNEQALAEGRFELLRCRALWPDGMPLHAPELDPPPPAASLPTGSVSRTAEVFLTIPTRRAQVPLVATTDERKDARFVERPLEVADDQNPDQVQTIDVAIKNARLCVGRDGLEGMVVLKLAELERTIDGAWSLRRDFVPPLAVVGAAPQLVRKVQELVGRASARAEELTAQRRLRGDALEFNAADLLNFWLLHTLNGHLPRLRHLLTVPSVHPERLYEALLGLFGGLLAFSPSASREAPPYQHEAIGDCFGMLLTQIYELLGVIVRARYTLIPLKQTRNAWDGRVEDQKLLEAAHFYLVATGDLPRAEFERLPTACKVADSSRVESLARTANPGLALVPVPRPPSPVPVRKDAVYFQVKADGPLWQEIRRSGQIGVFVPRAPEGLQLELVALHDAAGAAA
jgi:type VI secretion system protein ImpJ